MDRVLFSALLLFGCALTLGACAENAAVAGSGREPPPASAGEPPGEPEAQAFSTWLEGMKAEALAAGIRPATVNGPLASARFLPRTVALDGRQPEFNRPFGDYLRNTAPESRAQRGRALLGTHAALLGRLEDRYGVPASVLVALWGVETNFGDIIGSTPILDTLATLAFEGRRGSFFRAQLLDALRLIDEDGIDPGSLIGSWAGAMGQMQFMPTTFRAQAVDGDGDGRLDPWRSIPDALASGAHYLAALGWKTHEPWGREVSVPPGFDLALSGQELIRPVAEWSALGLRTAQGAPLPEDPNAAGALILPSGARGPAFLVYDNFRILLKWNRSLYYALAAGILSDRIAGGPDLVRPPPADEVPLRVAEVRLMQGRLNALGFDAGEPDGLIGAQTRAAIRAFQVRAGLPADGYADATLLRALDVSMP
ncbi:lytic murein transglycosylase [Pararhodospirillum oryzae]|uniref:Lytic transglycosylase n=1 Tax=Pararhodospirillum oryzae TaxID=478448 RepID=A0A512H9C2_9PROT|nr:lytic murein transglycosylase [Pararhodospirillum oryzae]GEO82056.1 lytic transglycosylase [Pararhodospirillum oryzae]